MPDLQPVQDIEDWYATSDPWDYNSNADDQQRKHRLLSLIPRTTIGRTLDIGCGNGFVTFDLPGNEVVGVDVSQKGVEWARRAAEERPDAVRFSFLVASLFDLKPETLGRFDLIVITGVLYPQYIGQSSALIHMIIDSLLQPSGILVSCHINQWSAPRFPYIMLDLSYYPYREYIHRLEVYKK